MRKITHCILPFIALLLSVQMAAQRDYQIQIEVLEAQKEKITEQEKEALKQEVKEINKRLRKGSITLEEADELKKEAARKRALNIENKIAIVDNKIALLERNKGDIVGQENQPFEKQMEFFEDEKSVLGLKIKKSDFPKFDRKTRSNFVMGFGLHNNIIEGESLLNTPHQVLGSRYFELGYQFKTRLLRNSNWVRITYGLTYLSRGVKTDNQVFVVRSSPTFDANGRIVGPDVRLENANVFFQSETGELRKSKFRQDDIIVPIHFEFGPSTKRNYENFVRYSTKDKFKFGIGVYFGLNIKTIQKVEFNSDFSPGGGSSLEPDAFLVSSQQGRDAFWGLSFYMGKGNITWHLKYDITPNFGDSTDSFERNNISFGVRFEF